LSQVSDSKTASRSSKCRKTTPPDRAASPKIPHSSLSPRLTPIEADRIAPESAMTDVLL
jgi:hypothetical protein